MIIQVEIIKMVKQECEKNDFLDSLYVRKKIK